MLIIRLSIRVYQVAISPVITFLSGPGAGCRFEPTCSNYFLQACETHGVIRGGWIGIKRLARCHPWGGCGHDPVPEKAGNKSAKCLCVKACSLTHRHSEPANY